MNRYLRLQSLASVAITVTLLGNPVAAEPAKAPPPSAASTAVATPSPSTIRLLPPKLRRPSIPKTARKHLQEEYRNKWKHLPPGERKKVLALFQQAVGPALDRAIADHQSSNPTSPGGALIARPIDDPPPDPGPSLTVYASASPASGPAPLTVSFGAGAYDPWASVFDFYWDFGDGAADYNQYPVHTYTAPGTYLATVFASDDAGGSASDSVVITVSGPPGDLPPQVSAAATAVPGSLSVNFTATASDPDGYITSYAWSFGDGTGSSGQNPSHTYGAPGNYVASVTVTDNAGLAATASITVHVTSSTSPDYDADGLPDDFERQLADNFTPAYFLSLFEYPGTGLALLQDRSDAEVVTQIFPTSFPPTVTSYFRVMPLGIANGQSYLQIDYLTLWSRDDGLALSSACFSDIDILDFFGILPSLGTLLGGHDLDNERSAIRVVAPAVGGSYNTDAGAYRVDMVYTAAHEDTAFDHGDVEPISPPAGPEAHIAMFPSLSKHSTYLFWPHGFPLLQPWMIDATYAGIDFTCIFVSPDTCDLLYWIADETIWDCLTEKHVPQGWVLARPDLRTNVGEISRPLPGGSFIQSGQINQHLQKRFVIP